MGVVSGLAYFCLFSALVFRRAPVGNRATQAEHNRNTKMSTNDGDYISLKKLVECDYVREQYECGKNGIFYCLSIGATDLCMLIDFIRYM